MAGVAIVGNGRLKVTGGTTRASGNSGQLTIIGNAGSVIMVNGTLMPSARRCKRC